MKASRGTSLLELLVAQALALLLMVGVLQSMSQGLAQQRQIEDQTSLRESAQLLSLSLQINLASAGFVDWMDSGWAASTGARLDRVAQTLPGGVALFACPGDMQGSAWLHATGTASDRWRCGQIHPVRQTLQMVRQGAPSPGSIRRSDWNAQAGKDCLQQSSSGPWVVNRFYISVGNLGKQLLCAGSGNQTGQALAIGVEEWVFRFLVMHPGGSTQWLGTAQMGPAESAHWQRVVRVEVCWVMVGNSAGRGTNHSMASGPTRPTCQRGPDGEWLSNVTRQAGDRRSWQRHTHTVALLNTVKELP